MITRYLAALQLSVLAVVCCVSAKAQAADMFATSPGADLSAFSIEAANSSNTNTQGCNPALGTPLPGKQGKLYGNMGGCGPFGTGTIYEFNTLLGSLKVLHSFSALNPDGVTNVEGSQPRGEMVQDSSGTLYGTTSFGGTGGCGTIYSMTAKGTTFTLIHSFSAVSSSGTNSDGCSSLRGLIFGTDGALYGVTRAGGPSKKGTLFRVTTDGLSFKVLHVFSGGTQGAAGNGDLLAYEGKLYGITPGGGAFGCGIVFSIPEAGGVFSDLHDFTGVDGCSPHGGLVVAGDGLLYGTTASGGINGVGNIYRIGADGGAFTDLYDFAATGGTAGVNGFGSNVDGAQPIGLLTLGKDGKLYGLVGSGGANGNGTIFSIDTSGVFALIRSFDASDIKLTNAYGAAADSSLVETSSGTFWGTTGNGGGGANGTGTIFKLKLPLLKGNAYTIGAIKGAAPSVIEVSDPVVVTGLAANSPITITGGSYSINGGPFTSVPGTISNGDIVQVQLTSSATAKKKVSADVKWGSKPKTSFDVTTR